MFRVTPLTGGKTVYDTPVGTGVLDGPLLKRFMIASPER